MFYTFRQTNSGGHNIIDDEVTKYVIIEARDAHEANFLAGEIGIYFDGCDKGYDCSCCGDRWNEVDESDAHEEPLIYRKCPEHYYIPDKTGWSERPDEDFLDYCYLYLRDGVKKTYHVDPETKVVTVKDTFYNV